MGYNSHKKKKLEGLAKICLAGFLGLTSCVAGQFEAVILNDAPDYKQVNPDEEIKDPDEEAREIPFAYFNAADLRGNTLNLFTLISKETALRRAGALGIYFKQEGIDLIGLGETDYKATLKTGFTDQPLEIAKAGGYDYAVIDQYMRGLLIPWTTGNAVISRYPLKTVHRHLYGEDEALDSRFGHLFKDFIHVKVKAGRRELDLILTHLDNEINPARREQELRKVHDYVVEEILERNPGAHVALMLDANAGKDSREMKNFLSKGIFRPPEKNYGIPTHRADHPTKDLSHVLATSNIRIKDYGRFCLKDDLGDYISDHCGVKGRFVLK